MVVYLLSFVKIQWFKLCHLFVSVICPLFIKWSFNGFIFCLLHEATVVYLILLIWNTTILQRNYNSLVYRYLKAWWCEHWAPSFTHNCLRTGTSEHTSWRSQTCWLIAQWHSRSAFPLRPTFCSLYGTLYLPCNFAFIRTETGLV